MGQPEPAEVDGGEGRGTSMVCPLAVTGECVSAARRRRRIARPDGGVREDRRLSDAVGSRVKRGTGRAFAATRTDRPGDQRPVIPPHFRGACWQRCRLQAGVGHRCERIPAGCPEVSAAPPTGRLRPVGGATVSVGQAVSTVMATGTPLVMMSYTAERAVDCSTIRCSVSGEASPLTVKRICICW